MNYAMFDTFRLTGAYQIHETEAIVWQGNDEEWKELQKPHRVCWRLDATLKEGYKMEDLKKDIHLNACGPTAKSLLKDAAMAKYFDGAPRLDYMRLNLNGMWSVGLDGVLFQDITPHKAIHKALEAYQSGFA